MGLDIVAGRAFSTADRLGAPYVTVINEALAGDLARTFGMTDPVGQVVDLPAIGFGTPTVRQRMTVVGIVKNERVESDLRAGVVGIAYVPIAQAPMLWTKLAVRTSAATAAIVPSVREALRQVDDRVALADVRTVDDLKSLSLSGAREPAWLIGIFAALSVLLAALGLYGVVSHSVSRQTREIGIRMALGARSSEVLQMVVQHVFTTIAAGLIAGLIAASLLTRAMQALLFEVSALDPTAFVIAAAVMTGVGATAALLPARRATRVDPTIALRQE
jgi:putative ABC transport system permease protein